MRADSRPVEKGDKRPVKRLDAVDIRIAARAARVVLMLVALCGALGCSFSKDRKEAEQLAERYFTKMQGGDIEGALSLYSARFYEVTSRAEWLAFLENQRARCGKPETHPLFHGMSLARLERTRERLQRLCTRFGIQTVECRRR